MISLMMQEDYKAKGWLGMLLGVRLYYKFCWRASEGSTRRWRSCVVSLESVGKSAPIGS